MGGQFLGGEPWGRKGGEEGPYLHVNCFGDIKGEGEEAVSVPVSQKA